MARQRVVAETLHHGSRLFRSGSPTAVYQPIDLHCGKLFETAEEVGYGSIPDRHDEFIQVDKSQPTGREAMAGQAVVVGSKLTSVARPVGIVHDALFDVRLEYLPCTIRTLIIIYIELFHTLGLMPFYPLHEIGSLILCNGTDGEIMHRKGMVVSQLMLQTYCIRHAKPQYPAPTIARHLVRYHSGNDFCGYFVHCYFRALG